MPAYSSYKISFAGEKADIEAATTILSAVFGDKIPMNEYMVNVKPLGVEIGMNGLWWNYKNVAGMHVNTCIFDTVNTSAAKDYVDLVEIVVVRLDAVIGVYKRAHLILSVAELIYFVTVEAYIHTAPRF